MMTMIGLAGLSDAKGPGKGYMGGTGVMVEEDPPDDTGGLPDDVEGPLNDNISDKGKLFGDLYVILRYKGGETKNVYQYDENGEPVMEKVLYVDDDGFSGMVDRQVRESGIAVGGEPVLTEDFIEYQIPIFAEEEVTLSSEDPGDEEPIGYEINPATGGTWFISPTPSLCVQPLANYKRWGNVSTIDDEGKTEDEIRESNQIPMVQSYDPTWGRTEFSLGVDENEDGLVDSAFFIEPGYTWEDPTNGEVTYLEGVLWTDLVQEVHFGRLNGARAPEAVHQHAFDEAIASLNVAEDITLDASGRLLLLKPVYDEFVVDPLTGEPLKLESIWKAIDSPLENLALYHKVLKDGHLVTPFLEQTPIDRSGPGGIPIRMMVELEDGPSTALRPTLDESTCVMLRAKGLGNLLPAEEDMIWYWAWTEVVGEEIVLCFDTSETSPFEGMAEDSIPKNLDQFYGINPDLDLVEATDRTDFDDCAAYLAAAADKTGKITVDHVVYLNSIMGLNKVLGTSVDGSVDYSKTPEFYNFGLIGEASYPYNRDDTVKSRGIEVINGSGEPEEKLGHVEALKDIYSYLGDNGGGDPAPGYESTWMEDVFDLLVNAEFRDHGDLDADGNPTTFVADDIGGFAQESDDNLAVIKFVHTFQIPDKR